MSVYRRQATLMKDADMRGDTRYVIASIFQSAREYYHYLDRRIIFTYRRMPLSLSQQNGLARRASGGHRAAHFLKFD